MLPAVRTAVMATPGGRGFRPPRSERILTAERVNGLPNQGAARQSYSKLKWVRLVILAISAHQQALYHQLRGPIRRLTRGCRGFTRRKGGSQGSRAPGRG